MQEEAKLLVVQYQLLKFNFDSDIKEISDIERNDYSFSDGWGLIDSHFFKKEILRKYFKHSLWSAIQIRIGGYKGVLMTADLSDHSQKILVRKSMRKFELNPLQIDVDLEVIRLATYSPGYLNKQIILLLWSNGIDPQIFIDLQRNYFLKLKEYYNLQNLGINHKYPAELFQSFKFIQSKLIDLHAKGVDYYNDPFIKPIIKTIWYNRLRNLRKKFRIYDSLGWNLIGVMDPYDCLQEGEVFIQYWKRTRYANKREAYSKTIITGKVLVTRSPTVHPGDIRILNAVDEPALKGYVNVLVFSSKGDRPDQSKMGSGDLDGDVYWINWRKEFVQNYNEREPDENHVSEEVYENKSLVRRALVDSNNNLSRAQWVENFVAFLK